MHRNLDFLSDNMYGLVNNGQAFHRCSTLWETAAGQSLALGPLVGLEPVLLERVLDMLDLRIGEIREQRDPRKIMDPSKSQENLLYATLAWLATILNWRDGPRGKWSIASLREVL